MMAKEIDIQRCLEAAEAADFAGMALRQAVDKAKLQQTSEAHSLIEGARKDWQDTGDLMDWDSRA